MAFTGKEIPPSDIHPVATGTESNRNVERIELRPIDAGRSCSMALPYRTRIMKRGEVEVFHDQMGYWLWKPATCTVIQALAIPRGQTALTTGRASADVRSWSRLSGRSATRST